MGKRSANVHNRAPRRGTEPVRRREETLSADQTRRGAAACAAREDAPEKERPAAVASVAAAPAERAPRRERGRRETDESLLSILLDIAMEKKAAMMRGLRRTRRRARHVMREQRAHRFPESDRLLVELVLFLGNMLPFLASRLTEDRRGRRSRQLAGRMSLLRGNLERAWEQKKLRPLPFLAGTAAVALVALGCSLYTVGTTVSYDGEEIASVRSRSAADSALNQLEQITSRAIGEEYTVDASLLHYSSQLLPRSELVDAEELEEDLSEEIGLVTYGYSLYVDGTMLGATPYEGALEELLKQLKDGISDENTISCDFKETVEIKPGYIPIEQIVNLGYLAETLYSTKTAEVTYEVKKGDTWSEIAESHGLTNKELLALNPGYDIDRLSIGEVLTLSASVPYLTMTVVEQERYLASIPYDIEYTDSADLYKGDYKITSPGEYGSADTVANVTYVNGEEQERVVLSSVTLKEPVTEQRLQGTKERPTWMPTGTFRWPCSGTITSRFGYRNLSYSYASTNHKGIDIANKRGTAICAADGGTVTYAGWMSGYGYLVRIDHGNGYVTYYGHNSSLLVSVGQHVYKGQQIARMGSTGNSTGNHCHFEVRYNGTPRNPLNYLP